MGCSNQLNWALCLLKSIDLQFFEQGRNEVRPSSPSWMAWAKVHPMKIPMDYQPLFCDQMGPRGGPKSVPGSKWVPSWPETNPILSPRKLLQSKIVINSYQLVLDGPSICKQKNVRFPPPEGAGGQILKITLWAKTVFARYFFKLFFQLKVVLKYSLKHIKNLGTCFSSNWRNLENSVFHLSWYILT